MLSSLRKLFSSTTLTGESRAFVEKLASSFVWILAIGIRGTPNIGRTYDARALEAVDRLELADLTDDDSVFAFNYGREGRQILPFFSSEDCARQFLNTKKWGEASPFQPYELLAGFLTAPGNEIFDLILDPGLPTEKSLLSEEKALLRKLTERAAGTR